MTFDIFYKIMFTCLLRMLSAAVLLSWHYIQSQLVILVSSILPTQSHVGFCDRKDFPQLFPLFMDNIPSLCCHYCLTKFFICSMHKSGCGNVMLVFKILIIVITMICSNSNLHLLIEPFSWVYYIPFRLSIGAADCIFKIIINCAGSTDQSNDNKVFHGVRDHWDHPCSRWELGPCLHGAACAVLGIRSASCCVVQVSIQRRDNCVFSDHGQYHSVLVSVLKPVQQLVDANKMEIGHSEGACVCTQAKAVLIGWNILVWTWFKRISNQYRFQYQLGKMETSTLD